MPRLSVAEAALSRALKVARTKGLMPTYLSTEGLREMGSDIRRRVFFSARTTHAGYLAELQKLNQRYIAGGYGNDLGQLRVEARALLAKAGYAPERGFPGDAKRGLPPAEAGSLRDLSSDQRLNLIFKTQEALAVGESQYLIGNSRQRLFTHPAWELVSSTANTPRIDWPKRWLEAGGPVTSNGRLIAPKWHVVWRKLGDSSRFDDALDTTHPPYAFNSERLWEERTRRQAQAAGFVRLKAPAGWQVTAPEPLDTEAARDALLEAAGISKETPLTERARKRLDETLAKMVDDASEVKLETVDALPVARTAEEVTKRRSVLRKMQELARKWIGKR